GVSMALSSTLPLTSSCASSSWPSCRSTASVTPSLPIISVSASGFAKARSWARCLVVSIKYILLVGFFRFSGLQPRFQLLTQLAQCAAAVGDPVFGLGRQFAERAGVFGYIKQRVIAEAAFAVAFAEQFALAFAAHGERFAARQDACN